MNILPIYNEDNVGDSLSKLNYNFLLLNSENCSVQNNKKENDEFLNNFEKLLDDLDEFIPNVNYDYLQKLESTVLLLSSYWNNFEFTVQFPFNPTNGYTVDLIAAGELGNLESSTDQTTQTNILAKALISKNLYSNLEDAIVGLENKEIVYVLRDSNGNYESWDYLNYSNIFSFSIDIEDNFYLDGNLIDLYVFPYYSLITPVSLSLAQENLGIDFANKIATLNGVDQNPNKKTNGLIENNLVVYSITEKEAFDDFEEILDVTEFRPDVKKLSNYIPFNNPVYAVNFKKNKDTFLESFLSNPKLNQVCIDFLDNNYNPSKYIDNTIVNVIFFLYNTNALYDEFKASVVTNYFRDEQLSSPAVKNDVFKSVNKKLTLKAPNSNTVFDVTFSKQEVYFEKIVTVRYIKKTKTLFIPVENSDVPKIKNEPYWEFISANLGISYPKGVVNIIPNLDTAPRYIIPKEPTKTITNTTLQQFPVTINTKEGDILETKSKDTYKLK